MITYDYKDRGTSSGLKGVAVGSAVIANIKTHYKEPHPNVKKSDGTPFDVWFEILLDVGRSFQPTLDLFGDWEKNEKGEIKNFGSAFKIGDLFAVAQANADDKGIKMVVDSKGIIPVDQVKALIGKKISVLRYVKGIGKNGKPQWVHWDTVYFPDQTAGHVEKFKAVLKGKNDWLRKRYKPEVLDESDNGTSFDPREFADEAPAKSEEGSF